MAKKKGEGKCKRERLPRNRKMIDKQVTRETAGKKQGVGLGKRGKK